MTRQLTPTANSSRILQERWRNVTRPHLLVSVRSLEEAVLAFEAKVDWIDLKEPLAGPLGPVEASVAQEVARRIGPRCPLSAALGELSAWPNGLAEQLLHVAEIDVVKLGLSNCGQTSGWQDHWLSAHQLAKDAGKSLVAVAYADWERALAPRPCDIALFAYEAGSPFLLVDTYDKRFGSIFNVMSKKDVYELLCAARDFGLVTVLAGSVNLTILPGLPTELIDVVAVRGAVCPGKRTATLCKELVVQFQAALRDCQ